MSRLTGLFGLSTPASLDSYLRSSRVRVVINALHAKSGGGITYLQNMIPLLAQDERLELHIFLHRDQLSIFHPIDERIIVHAFNFPLGLVRLMVWEQLILPIMANIMSADVIFSPANFGSILVRRQVILLRNALAVAKTETRWIKRLYWIALGIITFVSLLRVKRAIAVSRYAAKSLSLGFARILSDKIRIIHHGISKNFSADETVERQNFILAVSDIYVQKNLHMLFHAMKTVLNKHPNMTLMIAGEKIDNWYYEYINSLIIDLGISDNIKFIGKLSANDLLNHYRTCLMFVFPSTAETFGNPLVEAMACGAPIACSNSTAMPEVVGDAALLFNPMDDADIASAILALIEDADMRSNLSRKGLERARQFSWATTTEKTVECLLEACHRKPE